jgi:activator of 2-hydroxyglutaryl-CoA dehydratase
VEPDVTFTGGVARNTAMIAALNEGLGIDVNVSDESHYMGALGAALFALDHIQASRAPAHPREKAS